MINLKWKMENYLPYIIFHLGFFIFLSVSSELKVESEELRVVQRLVENRTPKAPLLTKEGWPALRPGWFFATRYKDLWPNHDYRFSPAEAKNHPVGETPPPLLCK